MIPIRQLKRLLFIFSLVGVFGAIKPMDPYRKRALDDLESNIKNSSWHSIIERVALDQLFSSDICQYKTSEMGEKLRTGKSTEGILKDQTLFQALLLKIVDYWFAGD